jgi:hypothetical protein
MLTRILTAGTLAGTTLLSPLASPVGATTDTTPPEGGDQCLLPSPQPNAAVEDRSIRCFPTLAAATRAAQSRGEFTIATHFTGQRGQGDAYVRTGSSCADTWLPSETWAANLSSTQMSGACTSAKHYTNANCSGSYQIISTQSASSLASPLDDNVRCVKYS